MYKKRIKYITLLFFLLPLVMPWGVGASAYGAREGNPAGVGDSLVQDSTRLIVDTLGRDTIVGVSPSGDSLMLESITTTTIDSSMIRPERKAFLDAPIFGKSKDSLVYDVSDRSISVYTDGKIDYQEMSLEAEYIRINTINKNVRAEGRIFDTLTNEYIRPIFTEKEQIYNIDSMDYNMESSKGLIHGVNTKEGEGILYGGTVKKMKDNTVHMHNGRYTVCDADCPHFYLQMTKGTTVPGKQTIFGPSYMVFEDVPIYFLGLPFGFFPMQQDQKGGFIFPEIGEEYVKGFFIREGGWYQPIGDYGNMALTGGIYTYGSWEVGLSSSYSLRYKFSGNFSFDYAKDKIGDKESTDYYEQSNMAIRWTHSQDAKFMPGTTFSASVNYSSSNYNKYNATTISDYLNTQTSSSISLSKSWSGKPFSLSINASMSQNSTDSTVSLNLPTATFSVSRTTPFKRQNAVGSERWYEKIGFTYTANFKADVSSFKEDLLFKQEMFDQMRVGMKHTLPVSASFTVLKYLNITPSISYNERWYTRRIDQSWDDQTEAIVRDTTHGFYRLWDASASMSFNTKLYGTYQLGRGLRQKPAIFRHVFTPTFTASFTPDFGTRYMSTAQSDGTGENFYTYSPWVSEAYGTPSASRSAAISASFSNSLEAKFPSMRDSTGYKKITLIDQLSLSTSYNLIADSMNLSNISLSFSSSIFPKFPINISASLDPYAVDGDGTRINRYLVSDGGFLRLASLSFSMSYGWSSKSSKSSGQAAVNNISNNTNDMDMMNQNLANNFFEENPEQQLTSRDMALYSATQYYDFDIPWSLSVSYAYYYTNTGTGGSTTQSMNFNGSMNITDKWAITASAGYDLVKKALTPGTVRVTRDLHCWQMSFSWVPVGFRQSWSFNIAVKSSMLSDVLKYDKNNSFLDNYYTYY
ncbi:MAG: putative LPS assembly protein LptD [Rikenellaceae bacterium]